jgi:RNA polymerase sigma factor (TIGR02999 family)
LLDENTQPTISWLIGEADQGDQAAAKALFGSLYSELRRMAKRELAKRAGFVTISATTLLHEAYLNMAAREGQSFPDRGRFMAYAGRVMRSFIIDHARERQAQKRGGLFEITSLDTNTVENSVDHREVAQIGDALDELAKVEPELAEIVDLKFFCGLSFAEIGVLRNLSERTVQRDWERARLYLHDQVRTDLPT